MTTPKSNIEPQHNSLDQMDAANPDVTPTVKGASTSIPVANLQGEQVHDYQEQQPDQGDQLPQLQHQWQQKTSPLVGMAFSGVQLDRDVQKERAGSKPYDEQKTAGWTPGVMSSQKGDENLDYCQ